MIAPLAYHPIHSRDDNNLPTAYCFVLTSENGNKVLEDNFYTFKKTKSKLTERLRVNSNQVLEIVGDGNVEYCGKTKSFTFRSSTGVFYAKFEIHKPA